MSNTSLSTTGADVTAGTIGMMATITQEHTATSLYPTLATYGSQLVRSLHEKFETDATALLDDLANVSGASGADLAASVIIEAATALSGRDAKGPLVGVLHTIQIGDLKQDLATSTAAINASDSAMVGNVDGSNLTGFQGSWYGIPLFQTSLVVSDGTDREGAIFTADDTFGMYEIWGPRSEYDRDISLPGDEIACTWRYGVGEIRDTTGQGVRSSAS